MLSEKKKEIVFLLIQNAWYNAARLMQLEKGFVCFVYRQFFALFDAAIMQNDFQFQNRKVKN